MKTVIVSTYYRGIMKIQGDIVCKALETVPDAFQVPITCHLSPPFPPVTLLHHTNDGA